MYIAASSIGVTRSTQPTRPNRPRLRLTALAWPWAMYASVGISSRVADLLERNDAAADLDERAAAAEVGRIVDERPGEGRRVGDLDPVGGIFVVGEAAHRGQLRRQARAAVRSEREGADRSEAGAAVRAAHLLRRAEQDRAEHPAGDDRLLLRLGDAGRPNWPTGQASVVGAETR